MIQIFKTLANNLLVLPLLKLAYKLDLYALTRVIKVGGLITQNVRDRLRFLDPNAHLEGYDEHFDLIVNLATIRLLTPEILDDYAPPFLFTDLPDEAKKIHADRKSEYVDNKAEVSALVAKVEKDEDIVRLVLNYNLVRHLAATHVKENEKADYYLSKARKIQPKALPLKTKDLFALERSVRKESNRLRSEIGDRKTLKIPLSMEKAGALISVISCFFLISGYLYNRFLLGEFGIEVSQFFTLSDYLGSSVEAIRYSATGATFALIGLFWGIHRGSKKSYAQIESYQRRREYWPYVILVVSIAGVIRGYIHNLEIFYDASLLLIVVSSMYFGRGLAFRYFKQPLMALFLFVFIGSYAGYMFSSVGKEVYRLKYYPIDKIRVYDVKFKNAMPLEGSHLLIITGNGDYVFFLDRLKGVFVIPRGEILYFSRRSAVAEK